jgi:hypothetical protein
VKSIKYDLKENHREQILDAAKKSLIRTLYKLELTPAVA